MTADLGPNSEAVSALLEQFKGLNEPQWETVVDRFADAAISRQTAEAAQVLASGSAPDQGVADAIKAQMAEVGAIVTSACGDRFDEGVRPGVNGAVTMGMLAVGGLIPPLGVHGLAMRVSIQPLLTGIEGTGLEAATTYVEHLRELSPAGWGEIAAAVALFDALQGAAMAAVPAQGEEGPYRMQAALAMVLATGLGDSLPEAAVREAAEPFEGMLDVSARATLPSG